MSIDARINRKPIVDDLSAVQQIRAQAVVLFDVCPPKPDFVHASGETVGLRRIEIINGGFKEKLRIDLLFSAIDPAHIIASKHPVIAASIGVVDIDTAQHGILQRELRQFSHPAHKIFSIRQTGSFCVRDQYGPD